MPEIDWNAVTTAAATALVVTSVVTVAVEYFAKPRLEARKERILDQLRTRRALIALIVDVTFSASAVAVEVPKDAEPAARERILAERRRHYARLGELTLELSDRVGKYAGVYGWPVRETVLEYVMCVRGVVISPRLQRRQGEIIAGLGPHMAMVLDGPRRRGIKRVRALQEVHRLVKETHEPANAEGQQTLGSTSGQESAGRPS